jgi:hypothetical protein
MYDERGRERFAPETIRGSMRRRVEQRDSGKRSILAVAAAWALSVLAAAPVVAAPSDGPADASVSKAKSDEAHYVAEIKPEGPYAVGKEGLVEVVVAAKGDYKLNPQFPIKFKLDKPSDGISLPKDVLRREDGTFDERGGNFKVPFTAARAGKFTIAGTMSISVCNEKRCLMEKVPLDLEVTVQ